MNELNTCELHRRSISENDKWRIKQVFKECDHNSKGYLCKEDLKVAILSIFGYKPTKLWIRGCGCSYEIEQLMGIGCKENVRGVTLDRFRSIMSAKLSLEDPDQEIRQMFNTFDIECKGFLTITDLKHAFKATAPYLPESTVLSCFQNMDRDNDGRVSFRDFEFCMKFNTDIGL